MSTKTNISTDSGPIKVAPLKFKSKNKGLKIQSSIQSSSRHEHIPRGKLGSDLVHSLRDIDTPIGRDVTCGNPYKKVSIKNTNK